MRYICISVTTSSHTGFMRHTCIGGMGGARPADIINSMLPINKGGGRHSALISSMVDSDPQKLCTFGRGIKSPQKVEKRHTYCQSCSMEVAYDLY